MAFVFDIIWIKGNAIPHVDALNRLNFESKYVEGIEHYSG